MSKAPEARTPASVGKLAVLMVTAFMDMVGVLMIIPLLPFYAQSMGAGGFVVGLLVSSFSVAQLLMAPVWGRLSDHYGRRPALIVGMTASAIAYVIFAYAGSLWLLFLSRLVQGAGGGTVSVIQAYVADAMPPKDRARALGWLSASTNAGVALGPLLGAFALKWGTPGPGLLAAALSAVNIAFAWRFLVESRDLAEATAARSQPRALGRSRQAVLEVATHPNEPASRLIWIYAIAIGAFQGSTAILALFLAARFGVTAKTIGYFFAYIGVMSVVTRAVILGWAVDRLGEAKLSRLGLALLATGLALLPLHASAREPGADVRAAGARGRAHSARHGVHVPLRDLAPLARGLEPRARPLHGRAADVRRRGARDLPGRLRIPFRPGHGAAVPPGRGPRGGNDPARASDGELHHRSGVKRATGGSWIDPAPSSGPWPPRRRPSGLRGAGFAPGCEARRSRFRPERSRGP